MTTNNSHTLTSSKFQLLPVIPPVQFESALGIRSSARWLGLYWEPQLNQLCYTDGETVNIGNAHAWQLFCAHPQIQPSLAPYQLGNDTDDNNDSVQHYLLLDRQNHRFYIGESALVEDYLKHPETLDLLAQLDTPSTLPHRLNRHFWQVRSLKIKNRWLLFLIGVSIVAIAVILLHEIGEFIFDLLEFWDD